MRKHSLSLLQKALLAVTVVLLPVILIFIYSYNRSEEHLRVHVLNDLTFIAEAYEGQVYQFIEMTKRRMEDFSSDGFIIERFQNVIEGQKSAVKPLNDYISKYKLPLNRAVNAINLISLDGQVVASTDNSALGKYSLRGATVKKGQGSIHDATVISGTTDVLISVSLFSRRNGRHIGFIEGRIDLSELNHVLSGHLSKQLGALSWSKGKKKTMEIYLVNKDTRMITESMFVKDAILKQRVDTVPVRECLKSNMEFTGFYKNYRGVEVAGASMCLPIVGWVLLTEVEADDVLSPLKEMRQDAFIGAGVVVSLIILLLAAFYRDVVQRLRMITGAADSLSKGDYNVVLPVQSQDEVGRLTGTFNLMTTNIKERSKEVTENQEKLYRLNRLYSVLSRINEAIIYIHDRDKLYEEACRIVVEDGGFLLAWIGMVEPSTSLVKPVAHCCGEEGSYLNGLTISIRDVPEGRGMTGTAIREGRHVVCNDMENDPRMLPWLEKALSYGYRSSASFPLHHGGKAIGALSIYSGEPFFFNDEEIAMIERLADNISFAIGMIETERQARLSEAMLLQSNTLLKTISRAQSEFILNINTQVLFDGLLKDLLALTGSEYGFIGEIFYETDGNPYLKTHAITNIAWNDETRALYEKYAPVMEFCNLKSLFGAVMTTGKPVISNNPATDHRRCGLPEGHPPLNAFLGLPFYSGKNIIGTVGIANRQNGYDEKLVEYLQPFLSTCSNIIEAHRNRELRLHTEEALKKSEERFRNLVETTSDWIWEIDEKGAYTYVSPKVKELLGYEPEEVLGKTPFDFMSEDEAKRVTAIFEPIASEHGPIVSIENRNIHKDGQTVVLETSGVPVFDAEGRFHGYRGVDRDITRHKNLEAQLMHSQKMEAVGQLAGGIAHDFNNALTAILGFSKLIIMKRGDDELVKNYTQHIVDAGESAARLVQGILAFSRKQTIIPQPIDITELVKNVEKILLRLIGEDIEFKTVLTENHLIVKADPTQVEQVLMNLATNARDAMPDGGAITIGIESVKLEDEFVKAHGYGEPGPYALLSFADTGMGMDEETKRKIFEPFFTTKEVGKGTGLGLAMVYGVIKQHGGFINVYSEPGKGTTFKLYLPLIEPVTETKGYREGIIPPRGTETVLLAEDDERVRRITLSILEDFGYDVIVAVNGEDAVRKFMECKDNIHLCIFDMVMPKKGGREAYEEMKKIRSDIKVIFMSGYAADKTKGIVEDGLDFISKPVSPMEFMIKVREVLDR